MVEFTLIIGFGDIQVLSDLNKSEDKTFIGTGLENYGGREIRFVYIDNSFEVFQ